MPQGAAVQQLSRMCRNNGRSVETKPCWKGYKFTCKHEMETFISPELELVKAWHFCYTLIDIENFVADIDSLSNRTRKEFFTRYCPQMKRVTTCEVDLLEAAKRCLNKDSYIFNKAMVGFTPDVVDLVCKNDGEILFKPDAITSVGCLDQMRSYLVQCMNQLGMEASSWSLPYLTRTQCGTLSKLRQCVERKLDVCKAPNLIAVYDLFEDALVRLTPCRNTI
ncbi:AGAP006275-PA-like protein [Anopheles sinensis]|uniref:AGAP006275-PA-like protein n=1 Tax=Anopheles sinensis TaxID=74873 RepID=A0A084WKF3_ANOSI|nr:AGAP006275-PA-like protein [Anopheles sinensis]